MAESMNIRSKRSSYTLNTASFFDPNTPRNLDQNSEQRYSIADIPGNRVYESLSFRAKKPNRALPLNIRCRYNQSGVVKK